MKRNLLWSAVVLGATTCGAVANAMDIPLVNPTFLDNGFTNEEQFIQNTGNNNPSSLDGWGAEGLVRVFSLNLDGDGDPTTASAGQNRVWNAWAAGDGLGQVGFQSFQDPVNAIYQDVSSFTEGATYVFSVQAGPGFEGGSQDAFFQIIRASDNTLLAETLSPGLTVSSDVASTTESVSYTATAADVGSAIRVRFGTNVGGSGTVVFANPTLSVVPEPTTLAMLAASLPLALASRRRK